MDFVLSTLCSLAVVLAVVLAASGVFGYVVLEPILKAPRNEPASLRLSLSDFLCLFVLLSIPFSFMSFVVRTERDVSQEVIAGGLFLTCAFAYLWYRGTLMLTAVGVMQVSHRSLFLAVLLPIAAIGSGILVPVLTGFTFVIMTHNDELDHLSDLVYFGWLLALPTTPIVAFASRRAVRWVINDPSAQQPLPPETPSPAEPDPLRADVES